jgi:hypothetical protein
MKEKPREGSYRRRRGNLRSWPPYWSRVSLHRSTGFVTHFFLVGFVSRPSRRGDFVSRGCSVACSVANSGGFAKELGLGEAKRASRRFRETGGFHEKKDIKQEKERGQNYIPIPDFKSSEEVGGVRTGPRCKLDQQGLLRCEGFL